MFYVISQLKDNKSVGIDLLPNEILKNSNILETLHKLLSICFEHSITPTIWQKSIISPIPKGDNKDPFLPLSYRGISLNSCQSKVYHSILNNRIMTYCYDFNLLVDEQNG